MNIKTMNSCILLVMLSLITLALFAKTNTAQDYDSLWYGLRPQYVLVGENSFYDSLGYLSFVYYYPKLVELLYLPISDLGDYSVLQGANIVVFLLVLYVIYKYITSFFENVTIEIELLLLCLFASIPAFCNISDTAKPDIFGVFFVMSSVYLFTMYFTKNQFSYVIWGMISLLLCTGTKLTYILWGGIVFALVMVCYIFKKKKIRIDLATKYLKKYAKEIFAAIFLVFGVHWRTYKLTGFPVYPIGLKIMQSIGFEPKSFMLEEQIDISSSSIVWETIIDRFYGFFLNPKDLPHVIMLWTSNVLLISVIAFILLKKKKNSNIFSNILTIVYTLITLYFMITMYNPDGNYFIIPIIVVSLHLLSFLDWGNKNKMCEGALLGVIVLCVLTQLPIMFVTHPSWAYGTKPFSKELIVDNFETESTNALIMQYNGYAQIENRVKKYEKTDRVISSSDAENTQFRFSCGVEGVGELYSPTLVNKKIMSDYNTFSAYLDSINIKALIVYSSDNTGYPAFVERYVAEHGCVNIITDTKAVCYEFR